MALVTRVDGRGLGESVAHAITCAARGGCEARPPPPLAQRRERRPVPPARPAVPATRATAAFQALRGVAEVAKRAWIFCPGYRRYRSELENPRVPTEPIPLE